MKLKALFLSTIFACSCFATLAQDIQPAVEKFTQAQQLAKEKKFAQAIPALEEALSMAEEIEGDGAVALADDIKKMIPKIYMFDGATLVQAKKFQEGVEQLLKAEDLAKKYGVGDVRRQAARYASTAMMAMGIEFFNEKNFPKALEIFKQGYEQDPKNIQLALFTAKAYAETKDLNSALKLFGEVIAAGAENSKYAANAKDAQNDINNYVLVAASEAAAKGELDSVAMYVDKIHAIDPENQQAPILLLQTANNLKKYNVVIEKGNEFFAGLTSPEDKSTAALLMGVAYQNQGNNAKALEFLKKATDGTAATQAQQIIKDLSAQ